MGRLERVARGAVARIASTRPMSYFYVNVAPHVDRRLIPLTRGWLSTGGVGIIGILATKGARTGAERRTPLLFTPDGERVVLVASRGGDVRHPAWYHNLRADPEVSFTIRGRERPYRARRARAEERERLWGKVTRRYPGYAAYQRRAGDREIPVIVLEPREA